MSGIRTRKPTGAVPWPLVLIEGGEKAGKSYAAAQFTASPRIGQAYWLDLGEGAADEYAAIPGANYEVLIHDGTWRDIVGQIVAVRDEAARAQKAGEPPVVLVIDSMTAEWDLLKAWTQDRANRSKAGKRALEADPDAEVKPAFNLWNDANARHGQLMELLMTFPGVVVVTARGKEVAALDDAGKPIPNVKDYRVEGHKTLAFDASAWVRLSRENPPVVVGVRSLVAGVSVRPGEKPKPWPQFSIDALVFDEMRCDPSGARVRELQPTSTADVIALSDDEVDAVLEEIAAAESLGVIDGIGRRVGARLPEGRADEVKAAAAARRTVLVGAADAPAPAEAPAPEPREPGWFPGVPGKIAAAQDQPALDAIGAALSHPALQVLPRTGELQRLLADREAELAGAVPPSHEEAVGTVAAELGGVETTEDAA